MVFVVVKGTHYPDEFTVERSLTDALSGGALVSAAAAAGTAVATTSTSSGAAEATSGTSAAPSPPSTAVTTIVPAIAHILNQRHHVRLMLMSAQELATMWPQQKRAVTGLAAEEEEDLRTARDAYQARIDAVYARLKDAKAPVSEDEFDVAERDLRTLTTRLYPAQCTHPDGTAEAAVQQLYTKHEDPDLDEDTRLVVYHCRVLLDPEWKANERVKEDEAALWFCGKAMEGTLATYCGRNEKSKVIVKVAPRKGPAPSGEPRMRYEDQRALYKAMCQRRETYEGLEESELRDRVLQQSRGAVHLSLGVPTPGVGSAGGAPGAAVRTDALRPIYARKEERELPIA